MTRQELERLETVAQAVYEVREQVAALAERIDALCELRTVNGTLTRSYIDRLEERCDERHGDVVRRLESLEREERATYGWRQRVTGMGVPVALLVSIVSVILTVVR